MENPEKIVAIFTDLDGTLWEGILAEKQELKLNRSYLKFLENCYKKGIQIIVVSKNDEDEVIKTFKEFSINLSLFTAVIANWDPKYLNIEKIISQTQFRPETTIFVDDNSLELTEVGTKIQKMICINATDWKKLQNISAIKDKKEQSEPEILERVNRYKTAISAHRLQETSKKEDVAFLKSLKREVSIGEIGGENLDRFTKLLVATHRTNFDPDKFKDYDETLNYLYEKIREDHRLFAVSTQEGGVSLGLTGEFVVKVVGKEAFVIDSAFSCGILGRDFEQKSILAFLDIMKRDKINKIYFSVKLTSTNVRVREIFDELGFDVYKKEGEHVTFFVNTDEYKPKEKYEWIRVLNESPKLDYYGIPSIMEFFDNVVKPLLKNNFKIVNLGSAQGEVLGHLQKNTRESFYAFIKEKNIKFKKVDLEILPGEDNIVGNAEDVHDLFTDESQDVVMAIELLEHTEHFWKVVNEMIRICKVGGYLVITVPSASHYPKHEYPIDLWRIGSETLKEFFPQEYFKIVKLAKEGDQSSPRRTMILVKKLKHFISNYSLPVRGKTDWKTGLTVFP